MTSAMTGAWEPVAAHPAAAAAGGRRGGGDGVGHAGGLEAVGREPCGGGVEDLVPAGSQVGLGHSGHGRILERTIVLDGGGQRRHTRPRKRTVLRFTEWSSCPTSPSPRLPPPPRAPPPPPPRPPPPRAAARRPAA